MSCSCQSHSSEAVVPPIRANRTLDEKLANLRANPGGAKDFILADAKDADMAAGLAAPGKDPRTGKTRSLAEYRDQMREVTRQGLIDIMLMSASTSEVLTIGEQLFEESRVTPAVRANDTTDIHLMAGGTYAGEASRPFRTATVEQIQSGRVNPEESERLLGADLGLYSITPNNQLDFDYVTVQAYKDFRIEAERKGLRHFLEVFDPNACAGACPADLGRFINDLIVRTLAGVPSSGRPVFLKIAYHGPRAMEELVSYDPTLVPGILGGSSGTTHDAFKLLEEAKRYGARAALFGRKINNSEHQLTFVTYLHAIANGRVGAEEAVKAYHGDLQKLGLKPYRALKDDLELTTTATSYAGTGSAAALAGKPEAAPLAAPAGRPEAAPAQRKGPPTTGSGTRPRVTESRSVPRTTESRGGGNRPAPPAPPVATAVIAHPGGGGNGFPKRADGAVDFKAMTPAQKVAYSRQRIQTDMTRTNGNGQN